MIMRASHKLTRSRTNRYITGLCGGIAEYFDWDVSLVRLSWIFTVIITGIFPGVVGYIAAALVIPEEGEL